MVSPSRYPISFSIASLSFVRQQSG
uniref:Uncharacterized protein n=1 Tax=Arundo donax TaxID=35708 RepID=A0A0A9G0M1_ARUDO